MKYQNCVMVTDLFALSFFTSRLCFLLDITDRTLTSRTFESFRPYVDANETFSMLAKSVIPYYIFLFLHRSMMIHFEYLPTLSEWLCEEKTPLTDWFELFLSIISLHFNYFSSQLTLLPPRFRNLPLWRTTAVVSSWFVRVLPRTR